MLTTFIRLDALQAPHHLVVSRGNSIFRVVESRGMRCMNGITPWILLSVHTGLENRFLMVNLDTRDRAVCKVLFGRAIVTYHIDGGGNRVPI